MVCVDVVTAPVLGTSESTRDTCLVKIRCVDPDYNFPAKKIDVYLTFQRSCPVDRHLLAL